MKNRVGRKQRGEMPGRQQLPDVDIKTTRSRRVCEAATAMLVAECRQR